MRAHPCIRKELVAQYHQFQCDLLFLQEVSSHDIAQQVARDLEMQCYFIQSGCRKGYHGAILFRHGLDVSVRSLEPQGCDRYLAAVQLSGENGVKLKLGVVHLIYPYADPSEQMWRRQQRELESLFQLGGDLDIVVGDFNALDDSPTCAWMRRQGYVDALEDGVDLRVDRAFVHASQQKAVEAKLLEMAALTINEQRVLLSDHPLIHVCLSGVR